MYQRHPKKKKHTQILEILQFFVLAKRESEKKNGLIRDKVEIENADMKIIKWPQQFHNKSYAIIYYWWVKHVNIESKLELVTAYHIRFIVKILWI